MNMQKQKKKVWFFNRKKRRITAEQIAAFGEALRLAEKSPATISKYTHDVAQFAAWLGDAPLDQDATLAYKEHLKATSAKTTVNTVIAALNKFFAWQNWPELKLKSLKIQRRMFLDEEELLDKSDYQKLLHAADQMGKIRLKHVMQTICSTGIRISELEYITVEAVNAKVAEIECKGKIRVIMLPDELVLILKEYIQDNRLKHGPVFVTKSGNPLDRSNVCRDMKKLCALAGVEPRKVFPHNLRHLFARTFYAETKDIVRLADLLGHSNVQTTRIYTLSTVKNENGTVNKLGLVG